jgi:hypothetical protein
MRYERTMRSWLCLAMLASGCASSTVNVNGKQLSRLDLDYVGQPFAIRASNAHPVPGSPSGGLHGNGGRVSGNVCGIDLTYDVEHDGDKTRLTGFLDDASFQSALEVRDEGVSRKITGRLTDRTGGVSLDLRKNHLFGNVGNRIFTMAREGDRYIGSVKISQSLEAQAIINGADELWTLPPAAQAAVLPSLLTCYGDELEGAMRGSLIVGFGGRQTWEGKRVSAIYHPISGDQFRTILNQTQGRTAGSGSLGGVQ